MKRTVFGLGVATVILVGVFVLLPLGCKPQANSGSGGNSASDNVLWRSELFDFAVDALLNKTDEHYSDEIQQRSINRLDQWVRLQKPLEGWEPDPVIAGVTEELLSGSETCWAWLNKSAHCSKGTTLVRLTRCPPSSAQRPCNSRRPGDDLR